jgi:hypothetical protein
MNIHEFAKILDGRKYREEITRQEEQLAKEFGYVVVFGYSDDNTEFRGAIYDEVSSYDGGTCYLNKKGLLEICECECKYFKNALKKMNTIEVVWCDKNSEFTWTYKTDIPHATFSIYDDDEPYCQGIVFDINNLGG